MNECKPLPGTELRGSELLDSLKASSELDEDVLGALREFMVGEWAGVGLGQGEGALFGKGLGGGRRWTRTSRGCLEVCGEPGINAGTTNCV